MSLTTPDKRPTRQPPPSDTAGHKVTRRRRHKDDNNQPQHPDCTAVKDDDPGDTASLQNRVIRLLLLAIEQSLLEQTHPLDTLKLIADTFRITITAYHLPEPTDQPSPHLPIDILERAVREVYGTNLLPSTRPSREDAVAEAPDQPIPDSPDTPPLYLSPPSL